MFKLNLIQENVEKMDIYSSWKRNFQTFIALTKDSQSEVDGDDDDVPVAGQNTAVVRVS
jgi:hypothetical protein